MIFITAFAVLCISSVMFAVYKVNLILIENDWLPLAPSSNGNVSSSAVGWTFCEFMVLVLVWVGATACTETIKKVRQDLQQQE
jgi:hypothetical protein